MNILIAGGTGFLGQALVRHWLNQEQHKLTVLGRHQNKIKQTFSDQVTALTWDNLSVEDIENNHVIINLCGKGIADGRWTERMKQRLLDSRLIPTKRLASLCAKSVNKPALLNASGVSIYGPQDALTDGLPPALDEKTPVDFDAEPDFLTLIGRRWEKATKPAINAGVRVVHLRLGVVIGDGGAVHKMKLPFQLGLGGPIAAGTQPFCWVALADVIGAIEFLVTHPNISGPVNVVSPNTVQQHAFASTLGRVLNRPAILPMPACMVKLLFGQMGQETLLSGNHVVPRVLQTQGYAFEHPDLEQALALALN